MLGLGANGHADTDLAHPLTHAHQHDVHDANATHDERDGPHNAQADGQARANGFTGGGNAGQIGYLKIIELVAGNVMAVAQQFLDVVLGFLHQGFIFGLRGDVVHAARPRHAHRYGSDGHHHQFAQVRAIQRAATARHHANHREWSPVYPQHLAQWVALVVVLVGNIGANHDDAVGRAHIGISQCHAAVNLPVAQCKHIRGHTQHGGAAVVIPI